MGFKINTGSTVADAPLFPTGGGSLRGLIGGWLAGFPYKFMTESDEYKQHSPDQVGILPNSSWVSLYYHDYNKAIAAAKALGGDKQGASLVWLANVKKTDVLNLVNAENWQDVISFEVKVPTLQSKKYRHEWHLIALPTMVHAAAVAMGHTVPTFDTSILTDQGTIFDDAQQFRLIGNPDATPEDEDHYTKSFFWKQRAALWNALGEKDVVRSAAPNTAVKDARFIATAPKLIECLEVVTLPWRTQVWARMMQLNDPRVDARTKNGDRLQISVVTEFFSDKAAAAKAVAEESAGNEDKPAASVAVKAELKVPEVWAELSLEDFKTNMADALGAGMSVPAAAKQLGVTVGEFTAWKKEFGL